ncbi:FAD-binding oxidoreductase [Marinihelvus fidelis]|uniref:FAD-binding oxidoreductase n=1 Tax=Marinihelvus fidelis TaxID=2613842 RepID=A0A5N0T713_9GAMM|nr:FAD-binding oxidoreductase [Marinihelvus fidelis]KAA9130548.1 FAD-binding oxidoreductase [Marinihelvus fidelis]
MNTTDQPTGHVDSYYAATANDRRRYPALEGTLDVDVAIVGGGFTGIASALTLAERGFRVAVLEAHRIGWGATGRNGGQLIDGISGSHRLETRFGDRARDILARLQWRGNDIVQQRIERYAIDCDYAPGYLEVASNRDHVADLQDQYRALQAAGHEHEFRLLDRDETCHATGTDAYIAALLTRRNGHLHPLNLCLGEARAAADLGALVFEQSPVTTIAHDQRPRVITEHGEVIADQVILGGNAYHRLEPGALSGRLFPAGSYIIATEPLDAATRQRINPLNASICEMKDILDYFRLSADGRMLFGGRCNYSGRDPKSIRSAMAPRMWKLYPELRDTRIDYEWGGKIGIVLNRVPMLGRINDNVWYAQGYSGHGVNTSHIMGEVLADAINGNTEAFDLFAAMPHHRIPGGRVFGNQVLALGMLYYRLRDLLR